MDAIAKNRDACFVRSACGVIGFIAATAGPVAAASAEEVKALSKSEVEALAVGKKLSYVRTSDGSTVTYDVHSDGKVYYSPPRTMRNLSISGEWTIGDNGALCFKWETADKYVSMQNGCFLFKGEGGKVHVYRRSAPDSPIGDVVE